MLFIVIPDCLTDLDNLHIGFGQEFFCLSHADFLEIIHKIASGILLE